METPFLNMLRLLVQHGLIEMSRKEAAADTLQTLDGNIDRQHKDDIQHAKNKYYNMNDFILQDTNKNNNITTNNNYNY